MDRWNLVLPRGGQNLSLSDESGSYSGSFIVNEELPQYSVGESLHLHADIDTKCISNWQLLWSADEMWNHFFTFSWAFDFIEELKEITLLKSRLHQSNNLNFVLIALFRVCVAFSPHYSPHKLPSVSLEVDWAHVIRQCQCGYLANIRVLLAAKEFKSNQTS